MRPKFWRYILMRLKFLVWDCRTDILSSRDQSCCEDYAGLYSIRIFTLNLEQLSDDNLNQLRALNGVIGVRTFLRLTLSNHSVLLDVLYRRFGITGKALAWFDAFLSDRHQTVHFGGTASDDTTLLFGVFESGLTVRWGRWRYLPLTQHSLSSLRGRYARS